MRGKSNILLIIFVRLVLFGGQLRYSRGEECPQLPCLEDKPKLHSTQELTIKMYYHEDGTPVSRNLWLKVCQLVREFGGLVKMDLKAGAKTQKVNGGLTCGTRCFEDQWQACLGYINMSYFSSCAAFDFHKSDIEYCMEYNKSDFIIVFNGEERKKLGIPDCQLPMLTLNDKFDPCIPLGEYEDLKRYICELYEYDVKPPCDSTL